LFGDKIGHYLQGSALHGSGSTIVDFRDEEFKVIREGPLKWPPSYC
jgi:tRNA A37 threonylcarbamoyladenosine synthetase subunit TsaC/SUA5/YrdC